MACHPATRRLLTSLNTFGVTPYSMTMKADLLSKLLQVIEQIPKDVLYDFCCSYAQEFSFRKETKGDVHATDSGQRPTFVRVLV